jgi:hypothetical protein
MSFLDEMQDKTQCASIVIIKNKWRYTVNDRPNPEVLMVIIICGEVSVKKAGRRLFQVLGACAQ